MTVDRDEMLRWYRDNRARSRLLFDLLVEAAYYSQPIALRHPIVFYEGHLPGFSFNTLVKKGLGRSSIDPRLEPLCGGEMNPQKTRVGWGGGGGAGGAGGPRGAGGGGGAGRAD